MTRDITSFPRNMKRKEIALGMQLGESIRFSYVMDARRFVSTMRNLELRATVKTVEDCTFVTRISRKIQGPDKAKGLSNLPQRNEQWS